MSVCKKCGKNLKSDEISLHKRIINPADNEYFCLDCMAEYFGCTAEFLNKKITHFKNMGCQFFSCK